MQYLQHHLQRTRWECKHTMCPGGRCFCCYSARLCVVPLLLEPHGICALVVGIQLNALVRLTPLFLEVCLLAHLTCTLRTSQHPLFFSPFSPPFKKINQLMDSLTSSLSRHRRSLRLRPWRLAPLLRQPHLREAQLDHSWRRHHHRRQYEVLARGMG